jgi:hypothetical protein
VIIGKLHEVCFQVEHERWENGGHHKRTAFGLVTIDAGASPFAYETIRV